ncbi:cytochrome P450 [Auriscalpium vulgare]|uniref:Cytochrome P450 n=1 Tax=Auriscalpium vulgare TaxID=40419 RepID=A0ACB8RN86_9AGAM|nr:cytochrome P450 [Auriscalpium vulgare]
MDSWFFNPSLTSIFAVCLPLLAYVLYNCVRWTIAYRNSPLRDLPGPPWKNFFTGSHERHIWEPDAVHIQQEWVAKYGAVFKYSSWFSVTKINVMDTKAVNHILTHVAEFEKPVEVRHVLGGILGKGLLFVEGAKHKQQRKVMSPAFGLPQIRRFTNLFIDKSIEVPIHIASFPLYQRWVQMRDILTSEIPHTPRGDGKLEIDVFAWMNKLTLDIIGLAGFNHPFQALHMDKPHELSEGVRGALNFDPFKMSFFLPVAIPPLRLVPTQRARHLKKTSAFVNVFGRQLIAERKREILASAEVDKKGGVEKRKIQGNDLLSLLIKANMASDIPDSQRMSDEDILAQVPTFLIAGHETTSTSIAWTLVALHTHPTVHAKLNAEVRAFATATPTMDELNALPYLDNVAREVLRLYAPVGNTERIATEDTVVPLGQPFVDRQGNRRFEYAARKGDKFLIPIRAINRSKELWGEDAEEFRPERWDNVPESVQAIPSVYSNILTFIAGAHACIGYRFSVVEMKAILFTFVRSFNFELAVPQEEVLMYTRIVGRPTLRSAPGVPQLPLRIWPA